MAISANVPDDFFGKQQGVAPVEGVPNNAELRTNASPQDFGAQVGGAVQKSADQAGDVANHYVQLYSDASARDGVTKASQALSDAEMQLKQAKGINAVPAFDAFKTRVKQIQDQYSQSMPNAIAQKNFLDDFSRESSGAIFRSGSYVGDEISQGAVSSINAKIANNVNQFALNAGNPTRSQYLMNVQDGALEYAHHMGLAPDAADKLVSHNVGEAYSAAIKANLQQNPNLAKTLFDEADKGSYVALRDGQQVTVPYLDAEHRAQIASEMGGEFRRQFGDQLAASRSYAMMGVGYDKEALRQSALNAGHDENYINAEMGRLDMLGNRANQVNTRYTVEKSLDNAHALAAAGQPLTSIPDEETIRAAYPNEPAKAQDVINEFHNQYKLAGVVGSFGTTPLSQLQQKVDELAPKAGQGASLSPDSAINWTMQHKGGFVTNDGGKGPTKFGINGESNPGVDIANLTQDQAAKIMHDKYWVGVGADKMSPQMAQVAFDTAVNMGVDKAKALVQASGGDPSRMIDLRREEYKTLAETNPDRYGKYAEGWNKRLDDLSQTIQGGPEDFANQAKLYKQASAAAQTYVKQLNDDPAGTIVSQDQNLNNMLNAGLKDPTKLGPYIDAMTARQKTLEVPDGYQAILPSAVATSYAQQITANPANAPDAMSKLEKQTGSYWPQVYHSLVTQGGLPANYQAVAHLNDDPKTKKDAYELSRWMGEDTKGKDTADLIGGTKAETAIKTSIASNTEIQQLEESLKRSRQSTEQVKSTIDAVINLAYAKTYYNKDPLAADHAIAAFTQKYSFMPNGNARVPNANFAAVQTNAEDVLTHLEMQAVAPADYKPDIHGTVLTANNYIDWVKNAPTWVTSPNEDALQLKDAEDRYVRDRSGKVISVPFNKPAPAPAAAPQNAEQQPGAIPLQPAMQ